MGASWEFNSAVTEVFDEMLSRSIPQYELMRETVFEVGSRFVKPGTDIVDLGSSRGEAIDLLLKHFGATNRYLCIETSPPMVAAFKERYASWIGSDVVRIAQADLRDYRLFAKASLAQSVLTLMFTPINYRQQIVAKVYDALIDGGAFVLVEKVLGEGATLDQLEVDIYHAMKERNGYSREEIDRKRLALEGIQVPVTARWNEELLRMAGFRQVDCFWRWMNFAAWVAVK